MHLKNKSFFHCVVIVHPSILQFSYYIVSMGKFLKPGKVVIVLNGRFAGRKAVIVKTFEDGTNSHKFGHVLVAGISKGPKRITKAMAAKSEKIIAKRSRITPFIKVLNMNHVMATRYQVDLDLKKLELAATKKDGEEVGEAFSVNFDEAAIKDPATRLNARKAVKKVFEEGYFAQDKRKNAKAEEGVQYFYQKLRF